ncbi:hypothetical protein [Streptomyces niveus]|uniref:hypothetical protein n=1 Tax=Streptomyces niveus TaxID=193462 RepID=UPI0033D38620
MIAETFTPTEIELLARITGTLAGSPAAAELSQPYRELADRARTAVLAEAAGIPAPPLASLLGPRPGEQVWVLHRTDRHEQVTTVYALESTALADLADHVRGSWDNVCCHEGMPERPPADNAEAVELYYGPDRNARPDESYSLLASEIVRSRRSRFVPLDFAFPDAATAEAANRGAVFHTADDDGPQCIEVLGVLTFAYVDARDGVVRISVHLDNADERAVRPDGTVPLTVVVEDTVLRDDSDVLAPHPTVLEELLADADTEQQAVIYAAAISSGLMWRCPKCQWPNPRAAAWCEGPGACRSAPSESGTALALEGPR